MTELFDIICLGMRVVEGNKKVLKLDLVNANCLLSGDPVYFSYDNSLSVGGIYEVEGTLKAGKIFKIVFSNTRFVKAYDDKKYCQEIRLAHQAAQTEYAAIIQAKKFKSDNSEILSGFVAARRAWQKTNAVGRMALEVRVLNYLRNGKDL